MDGDSGTGGSAGQASTGTQPQGGTDSAPPAGDVANGQDPATKGGTDPKDPKDATIESLRKENAAARIKLRQMEEADAERANAGKTEEQRTKDRLTELEKGIAEREAALKQRAIEYEVAVAGNRLGVIDLDVVTLLLQREKTLEFDEDGKPTNVEAAIKALIKDRPHLAKSAGSGDAGAGRGQDGRFAPADMNSQIRRAAGRRE